MSVTEVTAVKACGVTTIPNSWAKVLINTSAKRVTQRECIIKNSSYYAARKSNIYIHIF